MHIEDLMKDATAALQPILEKAYRIGRVAGRQEASDEFKTKITAVLHSEMAEPDAHLSASRGPVEASATLSKEDKVRATPGTVKPKVLQMLRDAPEGLTVKALIDGSDLKTNSVRTTLSILKNEGAVLGHGGRWMICPVIHSDGERSLEQLNGRTRDDGSGPNS